MLRLTKWRKLLVSCHQRPLPAPENEADSTHLCLADSQHRLTIQTHSTGSQHRLTSHTCVWQTHAQRSAARGFEKIILSSKLQVSYHQRPLPDPENEATPWLASASIVLYVGNTDMLCRFSFITLQSVHSTVRFAQVCQKVAVFQQAKCKRPPTNPYKVCLITEDPPLSPVHFLTA